MNASKVIKILDVTLFSPLTIEVQKYYTALNAINLQCTFDQGKSPNGRDRARVNIAPVKQRACGLVTQKIWRM